MEHRYSILVVEDEPKIRDGLKDFLEFHSFDVILAEHGLVAERLVAQKSFDLILLDLMLPKISGEQLCTRWRQGGLTTPILMLTAKGQEQEKIAGLNLGADDYITKPFSLEELLARIRAVLRRTDPAQSVAQTFTMKDLTIDTAGLKISRNGQSQSITQREADILRLFAANPNRVINRDEIYRQVWGDSLDDIETRTIDMHIAKLRGKIELDSADPQILKTIRGAGYIYEA